MCCALSGLLAHQDDIDAAEVHLADGLDLATACRSRAAPLVLLDARADALASALDVVDLLRGSPDVQVIAVVTVRCADATARMFAAGARGVVGADATAEELVAAVREVSAGHVYASRTIMRLTLEMVSQYLSSGSRSPLRQHETLSEREHAVVTQLMKGSTNTEIAQSLHIAEATVKAHLSRVMSKWNARDRVQVVIRAIGAGVVEHDAVRS
ncbi:response regulator transcription factor [Tersicoccus sp. Bi-70]|uniref:LuxR C-terminal-related transcriptional regulator n=1 Tax=Tersicoccus sp. Bi-70 TaxID=1897634 RepID=UPI000977E8F9|nr:response regulator transcription factor [Tersicoccus sp. Bi-70]OMH32263.1 hypothetical protein BGP79_07305 [Tersicoccus sp. Bi-70]